MNSPRNIYSAGALILTDPYADSETTRETIACVVFGRRNRFRQPGSISHQRQQLIAKLRPAERMEVEHANR